MQKIIDNYIYKAIKYILPLIFLLPFVVSEDYYFPYITPRNFLFRIIVSIVLAFYLYLYFRDKEKYSFGKNKVILAYFSFAIVLTIASLVAGDFLYSFWSNYERMEGLINLYHLIALFLVILGIYRKDKAWLQLIRISVWASFLMSLIALSQHWNINLFIESAGGNRVTGTLGNAIYLAVYGLFNFFLAIYLLLKYKNKKPQLELYLFYFLDVFLLTAEVFGWSKGFLTGIFSDFRLMILFLAPQIFINLQYYFYKKARTIRYAWPAYLLLLIFLNFTSLFNTHTRGVLVGIFVASIFIFIFLLFSKYVRKRTKSFILTALLLLLMFTSSIFVFKDSAFIQDNNTLKRVANISISDTTTETRILTWQLSWEAFKERPVFGWGEENFYRAFNKYFPNEIFKDRGSRVWFDRPHNVFLQQLIHGGIFGLLTYLSIFFFAASNLWRHYKNTRDPITISVLGGLLLAYLVQNFFVFDSLNSYILLLLFLAMTVFLSGEAKVNKKFVFEKYLVFVLPLLVLILGFYLNVPKMITNKEFIEEYNNLRNNIAQGLYQRQDLDKLESIIDRQYLGKFELRQVYAEFVPVLIQSRILAPEEVLYLVDRGQDFMRRSIEEQPQNVRHHSFLINMYVYAANIDPYYAEQGIDLIENKALALSPTRPQLYYSLGQFYLNLNNHDMAMKAFLQGRDLAPGVFNSYYNLILASLINKDVESANVYLKQLSVNVGNVAMQDYINIFSLYEYFGYKEEISKLEEDIINSF